MNLKSKQIAAIGDIHIKATDRGKWKECFQSVSEQAFALILCGDLTDTGQASEAEILLEELSVCSIPVIAVLGNHDYHDNQQDEIRHVLCNNKIHVLDGESVVINGVGFAGVKGFGGGFDRFMLPRFGEEMNKAYVQAAVEESLKLDQALYRLEGDDIDILKVAVLHYSPIKETVVGEPEEIFPFLGSSYLAEPLDRREVTVAFHGHAHHGHLEGATKQGVKVFNVAKPVLHNAGYTNPFFLYELPLQEKENQPVEHLIVAP
ncbi:metallophosphoesterase [Cytophagaceae bacterium DM2B3-1]|uniref:Metallophosphoesterase n=2 Tax=Xanthocytophaga TaxID=3078918 RepID=A0ABT7D0N5_9BACT|nr:MULTISPECIES: metallophosphoesterase [Xanthocytophaga]MDJ1470801.1 metallophosphoesterase [Xanthocytophaga flavus]MDJ1498727.1 metallophosphoesterase [Xanthocytophaga flavus]MDJ1506894.1 metallophosphoesterase [Xanthocytophaga agilis]